MVLRKTFKMSQSQYSIFSSVGWAYYI